MGGINEYQTWGSTPMCVSLLLSVNSAWEQGKRRTIFTPYVICKPNYFKKSNERSDPITRKRSHPSTTEPNALVNI